MNLVTRFLGEMEALEEARAIGKRWGYGNVIQYLKQAWDKDLQANCLAFAKNMKGREKAQFIKAWEKHFDVRRSVLAEDNRP